jgi:hypothetical protein
VVLRHGKYDERRATPGGQRQPEFRLQRIAAAPRLSTGPEPFVNEQTAAEHGLGHRIEDLLALPVT